MKRSTAVLSLCVLLLAVVLASAGCTASGTPPERPASTSPAAVEPSKGQSAPSSSTSGTGSSAGGSSSSVGGPSSTGAGGTAPAAVFAVIGDYGVNDKHEEAVAKLVASWDPDYIITTGDDYYIVAGGKGTAKYDESTGRYYSRWLKDITTKGKHAPKGLAAVNAFFPSLGNHDYSAGGLDNYLKYFRLPGDGFRNSSGNERYYDFVEGPIHFFVLNSNPDEPDGVTATSRQALWLKQQLAASTSTWNIVYDHHPPYSSDLVHSSTVYMQWPFAAWGADVVLSGHAHEYERIERNGIVYFVNGAGGSIRYFFGFPVVGDRLRYNKDWGAQKVTVTADALIFEFWNTAGTLIDSYRLPAAGR